MTVANLKPGTTVPIDPRALVGTPPLERGHAYNVADLDFAQRQAVEQAVRLAEAGNYPPSRAAAVEQLRRERESREALARPKGRRR